MSEVIQVLLACLLPDQIVMHVCLNHIHLKQCI